MKESNQTNKHTCTLILVENKAHHFGSYLSSSGEFRNDLPSKHKNYPNDSCVNCVFVSDKMRSGVSLAMYLILSVLHRNTLDGMQVPTGASYLKVELTLLSHMIVIICMSMYYFALFTIVGGLKNVNSFFFFIETITFSMI